MSAQRCQRCGRPVAVQAIIDSTECFNLGGRDCVTAEKSYRAGQVEALRNVVAGTTHHIDGNGRPVHPWVRDERAGLARVRWQALEALAALGDPDARRIVGRE